MVTAPTNAQQGRLAQETRKRFVARAERAMVELGAAVEARLAELMGEAAPSREMNNRRDAWSLYQRQRKTWVEGTCHDWQEALKPQTVKPKVRIESGFELVGTEAVEDKILASRLALDLMEAVGAELNDLYLRIKHLEDGRELERNDILRPEVLFLWMIQRWSTTGMTRQAWLTVHEVARKVLTEPLHHAYASCNVFLIERGVMPTIALEDRVKRVPSAEPRFEPSKAAALSVPQNTRGGPATGGRPDSAYGGAAEETRMLTRAVPMTRARGQAMGVVGQLKRLLTGSVGTNFESTAQLKPSAGLAAAMTRSSAAAAAGMGGDTLIQERNPAGVARAADDLRRWSTELKSKAETPNEKAVIEVVALMFQAILQEERIPPAIRLWVARLQMPVLRVALAEPDFFGTLDHPARQLIDRMGSCVMGFDASGINGSALETEVKRVVQVIEQYPETGRRVYQLVYDEFQKFLAQFLTDQASTQKAVSVAQQVEQKETLTIQYTIEMRNMLKDMPVSDAIAQFLFKVWAEVLAVAAVRKGPQHAETLALKKLASDLVWSASAKPNRSDRARVIGALPQLLQNLRAGMTLLGVPAQAQDAHIKTVNDTLADAFVSKTQAIPAAQIAAMAKRLAHLEDFVGEEGLSELPLDAQNIEMMLGMDASNIDVVTDGGSNPTAAMTAWAQELQIGSWFTLDHNGRVAQVQFVWRSERKHLNLFASTDGRSYLIQSARLAAYLQAGLLIPEEQETLTVRATRDALGKLAANPERLLS
jgi:hypothetical protein